MVQNRAGRFLDLALKKACTARTTLIEYVTINPCFKKALISGGNSVSGFPGAYTRAAKRETVKRIPCPVCR